MMKIKNIFGKLKREVSLINPLIEPSLYVVNLNLYYTRLIGFEIKQYEKFLKLNTSSELVDYIAQDTENYFEGKPSSRGIFQTESMRKNNPISKVISIKTPKIEICQKILQDKINQYNRSSIESGLNYLLTTYSWDYISGRSASINIYKLNSLNHFKEAYIEKERMVFRLEPEIYNIKTILKL